MLRFSLSIAVRNTYELRRLEYVLTTLLITPSSVIVMEEVGTVDIFISPNKSEVARLEE